MPGYKATEYNTRPRISPHAYRTDDLSPEQCVTIARALLLGTATVKDLMREFGISQGHVYRLARQYRQGRRR